MSKTIKLLQFFTHFEDLPHQRAAVKILEDALPAELLQDDAEWVETFRAAPKSPASNPYQAIAGLLALIRAGEGGYSSVNRGRAGDTPGGWAGLEAMTIAQVMDAQKREKVFAVGAYQFIPSTLAEVIAETRLPVALPFSAEVQDWLAMALILAGRKRPALTAYLRGQSDDLDAAQLELAKEWASIPGPDGRGFYDGDAAGNMATVKTEKVRTALIASRAALGGRGIESIPPPTPPTPPPPVRTPAYFSQRDNGADRDRTCFTSTAAMLAEMVKPGCIGTGNADYTSYYQRVKRYGDTTDAAAQVQALAELGIRARLVTNGDQKLIDQQVKRWGGLAVGWIHRGAVNHLDPNCVGHWGLIYAADQTHLMLHDPQGEPDLVNGGFVPGKAGAAVRCTRARFAKRWEVRRVAAGWLYNPGHGWALVVDGVKV